MKRVVGFVALTMLSVSSVLNVEADLISSYDADYDNADGSAQSNNRRKRRINRQIDQEVTTQRNYSNKKLKRMVKTFSPGDFTMLLQYADRSGLLDGNNNSKSDVSEEDQSEDNYPQSDVSDVQSQLEQLREDGKVKQYIQLQGQLRQTKQGREKRNLEQKLKNLKKDQNVRDYIQLQRQLRRTNRKASGPESSDIRSMTTTEEIEGVPAQTNSRRKRRRGTFSEDNGVENQQIADGEGTFSEDNGVENQPKKSKFKGIFSRNKRKRNSTEAVVPDSEDNGVENQPKKSRFKGIFSRNKRKRNSTAAVVPDLINKKEVILLNEPIIDGSKLKKSSVIVDKDIKLAGKGEANKSERKIVKLNPVSLNKDVKLAANNVETTDIEKKITSPSLSPLDKKEVLEHINLKENAKLLANLGNSGILIKETLKQVNDDRKNYNLIKIPSKDLKDNIQVNKFRAELDHYRKIFSSSLKKA